jgi:cell division septation protein DedD
MSEPYKDKIEVSLDGRQIFYLFFGGAVIVGLVFVLGVMVGRRVEARGHVDRAHTTAAADPLTALDRLDSTAMSFQGTLRGDPVKTPVEKRVDAIAKERAQEPPPSPAPSPAKKQPAPEKKPAPAPEKKAEKAEKPEKARYTLQLSSFHDKSEAEAYLAQVKGGGFSPYLAEGEVDGKQFFRVRLGSYRSLDAANDAKVAYEKVANKTAYVTKL